MTNKRQIPFLHWAKRSNGTRVAHWKPSPRLRKMGWHNRKLGTGDQEEEVVLAALALNKQVADWENARGSMPAPNKPRRRIFADLITEYRASSEWRDLAHATHKEYNTRLRFLESWAMDGRLPLDQLDTQMVIDLKEAMLARPKPKAEGEEDDDDEDEEGGRKPNPNLHRTAATLRVLRLLMNWAVARKWIEMNPTTNVRIPTPPSRTAALLPDQVEAAALAAEKSETPAVALALRLNLWIIQRRADVLALNRLSWRVLEDVEPSDRAILANPRGEVKGFRLRQQKTGKWVCCPVPPDMHDAVEAAFERSQWLVPDDSDLTRACPEYLFTRRVRPILDSVGLHKYEFRDMRRSGMMMYAQMRVTLPGITAISGHAVTGKKTILDTYMPGNERLACDAVATALRTIAARKQREQSNG